MQKLEGFGVARPIPPSGGYRRSAAAMRMPDAAGFLVSIAILQRIAVWASFFYGDSAGFVRFRVASGLLLAGPRSPLAQPAPESRVR
jgi:hypothetical protein